MTARRSTAARKNAAGSLRMVRGETLAPALDPLIHERVRLGIVSALAAHDTLSFRELKELLGLTDGNLSVHSRKLEEAGSLVCKKAFEDRVPKTSYRLSAAGRRALQTYLDHMEAVIRASRPR